MSIEAMKRAIEACPFCGSKDVKVHSPSGMFEAFAQCNNCCVTGPDGANESEAVLLWNTRTAIQQAESEPLTDTFVQTVPDKCDRILWRGRYLHLPIPNPAPGVPDDVVRDAERYRWLADCNNYEVGISILIDPKLTEHALGEAIDAAIDKAEGREA